MAMVQMDLFVDVASLPWYGRSPRALTRGAKALFLRREPQKDDRFFVDSDQTDLCLVALKPPRGDSPGAPLLVPLKRR